MPACHRIGARPMRPRPPKAPIAPGELACFARFARLAEERIRQSSPQPVKPGRGCRETGATESEAMSITELGRTGAARPPTGALIWPYVRKGW